MNYHQDDWVDLLSLAEFTMSNVISETTRVSPFFANCVNKCKQTPLDPLPLKTPKPGNRTEPEWVNKAGSDPVNKARSQPE
jgi:hypothetical protein